jgi:hypothetical protein
VDIKNTNKPITMKAIFCTIITVLLFTNENFYGQTIKIQYGRDWSQLKWPIDGEYSDFKTSLNGNTLFLGFDYFNRKYFNLNSNIGFLQKHGGKSYEKNYDGQHTTIVQSETSIKQLSINTKIYFKYPINEKLFPFLSLGLSYDYLLSQLHNEDRISNVEPIIYGLILGGGAYYNISRFQIGLNIDYNKYFSSFAILDPHPSSGMTGFLPLEDIKSHSFLASVTIGYILK